MSDINDISVLLVQHSNDKKTTITKKHGVTQRYCKCTIKKNNFECNNPCFCSSGPKRLGQPGTPGGQDLEAALRSLSARQQNHSSERPFFDVERERKLHTLASKCDEAECSSGFLTPNDSLVSSPAASTGTNYSNGSSRHSCGSSGGSRSYLPDRLQIVKPLEGKSLNFIELPCF